MKPDSELNLISKLAQKTTSTAHDPDLLTGIGDDCAIVTHNRDTLLAITTDTLVEGVHFDLIYFDPWHLGAKTAAVNLSDIAAMGARPRWAFLNIASRPGLPDGFWDAFMDGLFEKLSRFGAILAGGDTVSTPHDLSLTLTLIGELASGRCLMRSGARSGDIIYCSGYLGDAAAGLAYLKAKSHGRFHYDLTMNRCLRRPVDRHLNPEPRVGLGEALAMSRVVSAAIDLSDGAATDLAHICEASGLGAELYASMLPISRPTRLISRALGLSPIRLAVSGGEDFELLWTVSPKDELEMTRIASRSLGRSPFRIGRMIDGKGVHLKLNGRTIDITFCGYEHEI
ncbi:MAG: thiamine-phosphate kinase [Dissulfurimicrobium sp.]|uniref:thiamine-phosphate kinase n=1 Tax=Dissulfurimicrobium sp. TaxID=2022436 RepID=UPI00404B086B